MNQQEMTPQERAGHARHSEMLRQIQDGEGGKSVIVGADGKPVEQEVKVEKPEGAVKTEAEIAAENEVIARRQAQAKVEERAKEIQALMDADPDVEQCCDAVLRGFMILFWALNDLQSYDGMTAELVNHISESSRATAMTGRYNINELISTTKNKTLSFMKDKARRYAAEQKRRETKMAKFKSRWPTGIALPSKRMVEKFKTSFTAGRVIALHGPYDAVRAATKLCALTHHNQGGNVVYMSTDELVPKEIVFATDIYARSKWTNGAITDSAMNENMRYLVDKNCSLLVVEDLGNLYAAEAEGLTQRQRKVMALSRLYRYAYEHMLAVIVGHVPADDAEKTIFGDLANLAVTMPTHNVLMFEDETIDLTTKE